MNLFSKISKIALHLSAIFLFSIASWGQKDVLELLPGAYKLIYNESNGAQRLVGGGVSFVYQGSTMFCDSAYYFDKLKLIKAYGNVHLNSRDTLNLFCDSMHYNGKTKQAKLFGNVRARDREYKISTDTLEYDAKKRVGIYRYGGRVENILSNEMLTSRVGYFYPDTKNFFFSGKVNYRSDSLKMTTDTLRYQYLKKIIYFYGPTTILAKNATMKCDRGWYHTETDETSLIKNASVLKEGKFISGDTLYVNPTQAFSSGRGHVFYQDTASKVSFKGDRAYFSDKSRFGFLTGNALGMYALKKDTLFIHADTLFSYQDSTNQLKRIRGNYDVRFFSSDFQGICDSLSFEKATGKLEMFESPIVWSKNAELKANFMVVTLRDTLIEQVQLFAKSSAIMAIDSGSLFNQVAGKDMIAHFKENELIRLDVKGNAQTVYYPEETNQTDTTVIIQRKGMTRLYASDLRVDLDSGEVIGVTYIGLPDGVMYPMNKINKEEQFVQGFSWNPGKRPLQVADLLRKRIAQPVEEKSSISAKKTTSK